MLYDVLIAYIITFNLIDVSVTLWLVHNHIAVEANPLMTQAMEYGYLFFVFAKLFLVFGGCYILQKNKNKLIAKCSILIAFATYLMLMIYFLINIITLV